MGRLKFWVYALLILSLGGVHLWILSQSFSEHAVEQAHTQGYSGARDFQGLVQDHRQSLKQWALRVATKPSLMSLVQEGPWNARTFEDLRQAILAEAPSELSEVGFVAALKGRTGFYARPKEVALEDNAAVGLSSMATAGVDGV